MSIYDNVIKDEESVDNKLSAGLLMYNKNDFFLAKATFTTSWGIPKGGVKAGENELTAAKREFYEETGIKPPEDEALYTYIDVTPLPTTGRGKVVKCWLVKGDGTEVFNPPKEYYMKVNFGGTIKMMPECDKGRYINKDLAIITCIKYQLPILKKALQMI